jgi:sphingomyelin phosphodiesterase acid-like 3
VNYSNACGTSTQTPALDQLHWLAGTLDRARADGESVWLLTHIPPGINSYNSVETVQRGEGPVSFWHPELTGRFLQLVEQHPGAIQAAFVGHTHMDDFRLIHLKRKPALLLKLAPAVSPIFGNNPGYQVYQYDRASGAVQNYQTYYLTNLATDGKPTAQAAATWALEYDFQTAYGAHGLNPETVAQLADGLKTDAALQRQYTKFYGVSAPPEFTPQTFEIYRCAIANISAAEFLTALSGLPKPARPRYLPDRQRSAAAVGQ